MRAARIASVAVAALLVTTGAAYAQGAPVGAEAVDGIVTFFRNGMNGWDGAIRGMVRNVFFLLVLIQMATSQIMRVVRQQETSEVLAILTSDIIFCGFFLFLMETSLTWAPQIMAGFDTAARATGAPGVMPGAVFAGGLTIAGKVWNQTTGFDIAGSLAAMVAAGIIMACFAVIVASMVALLCSVAFLLSVSPIFLVFGGNRFTSDIAISFIRTVFSTGMQLFVLQLLAGLATTLMLNWANSFTKLEGVQLLAMMGCSIVILYLCLELPGTAQRIIGGASVGSGAGLIATGAGVVAAGTAAGAAASIAGTNVVGAGQAGRAAIGLAQEQIAASGGPQQGRIGSAMAVMGQAARNMGSAAVSDVGRRLSGQQTGHGSPTFRMAADISNQRRMLSEEQSRPTPPSSPQPSGRVGVP